MKENKMRGECSALGELRNGCGILVQILEDMTFTRRRWEDIVTINLGEIMLEVVYCINLAQERASGRFL
jgi:hypothetical protein